MVLVVELTDKSSPSVLSTAVDIASALSEQDIRVRIGARASG